MPHLQILIRPVVTEKATGLGEVAAAKPGAQGPGPRPTYTFEVHPQADKYQIRRAVEGQFSVNVTRVCTLILPGKTRRRGARVYRRPARKKAMVQLRHGQSIDLFAQEG